MGSTVSTPSFIIQPISVKLSSGWMHSSGLSELYHSLREPHNYGKSCDSHVVYLVTQWLAMTALAI